MLRQDKIASWFGAEILLLPQPVASHRLNYKVTIFIYGRNSIINTCLNSITRESTRLRKAVLDRTAMPMRMRLIYAHNRIFHRLTWFLVRMMIRVK